jgi:hypothetical protein
MTWGEIVASEKGRDWSLLRAEMDRPGRGYEREGGPTAPPRPLIRPGRSAAQLPEVLEELLVRWREGELAREKENPVFVFAEGQAAAVLEEAEAFLSCLRSGWRLVSDSFFASPEFLRELPLLSFTKEGRIEGDERGLIDHEMIAIASMECPEGAAAG